MLDEPRCSKTEARAAAVIHLVVPRADMTQQFGPAADAGPHADPGPSALRTELTRPLAAGA